MAKEDSQFFFRWIFPTAGGDKRNAHVILMNAEGDPYTAYKFETKFDPDVPIDSQTPRTHIYALSAPRPNYTPPSDPSDALLTPPKDKLPYSQSKREIAAVKWEKDLYASYVKFNHWPGEDVSSIQKDSKKDDDDNEGKEVKKIQKTFLLRHAVLKEEGPLAKVASSDKSLRFLVDGWRECKWKMSKSTGDMVAIKPFEMLASSAEICRYTPVTQVLSFSPRYMGLATHDCVITLWLHLVRLEMGYDW